MTRLFYILDIIFVYENTLIIIITNQALKFFLFIKKERQGVFAFSQHNYSEITAPTH